MERKRGLSRAAGTAVLLGVLSLGGRGEVSAAQVSEELSKERDCTTMLSIARDENCQGIGTECVRLCNEPDGGVSEEQLLIMECKPQMELQSWLNYNQSDLSQGRVMTFTITVVDSR